MARPRTDLCTHICARGATLPKVGKCGPPGLPASNVETVPTTPGRWLRGSNLRIPGTRHTDPLARAAAPAAPVGAGGSHVPLLLWTGHALLPVPRHRQLVSPRLGRGRRGFRAGGPCAQNCLENLCIILKRARGHHIQRLGCVAPRPYDVDGRTPLSGLRMVGAGARLLRLPRDRLLRPRARRGAVSQGRPPGVLVTMTKAVRSAVAAISTSLSHSRRGPVLLGVPFSVPGVGGRSWLGAAASRSGPPAWVPPRVVACRTRCPRRWALGSSLRSDPGAPLLGPALVPWTTRGVPRSLGGLGSFPPWPRRRRPDRSAEPSRRPLPGLACGPPSFFSGPLLFFLGSGPPR
jgi:hypothetical protein